MNRLETLVLRTHEMQRASQHVMPVLGKSMAVSYMMGSAKGAAPRVHYSSFIQRMVRVLQRVALLRLTASPSFAPSFFIPEEAKPEIQFEGTTPVTEEPLRVSVSQRSDPLTEFIRGIVQRFLRQRRRPISAAEPSEPPPPQKKTSYTIQKAPYTIPEYTKTIAAAMPLLIIPTPRPKAPPQGQRPTKGPKIPSGEAPKPKKPAPRSGVLERLMDRDKLEKRVSAATSGIMQGKAPEHLKGEAIKGFMIPEKTDLAKGSGLAQPEAAEPRTGIPPRMMIVSQMVHGLSRQALRVKIPEPVVAEMRAYETVWEERKRVVDVLSPQVAEAQRHGAILDWRPSILKTVRVASRRFLDMAKWARPVPSADIPRIPTVTVLTKPLEGVPEAELPSPALEVLEKEAESRTALVLSDAGRVVQQMAEKVAKAYKTGVASLLPVHRRTAAEGLVQASALRERVTEKLRSSAGMAEAVEGLSEELRIETLTPDKTHPLPQYLLKAYEYAGISRPPTALAPSRGEPGIATGAPPHPLRVYIDSAPRPAIAAAPVATTGAMESTGVPAPQPPSRSIQLALASKLAKIPGMNLGVGSLGEKLKEFAVLAPGMVVPAQVAASTMATSLGSVGAAAPKVHDALGAVKQVLSSKVEAESMMKVSLDSVVSSILRAPADRQTLQRAALAPPPGLPSLKLQEIMPVLSQAAAASQAAPQIPPRVRGERAAGRQRPIEIKVEQKISDLDLRELERKIARILREEARRYGVY
jgi:hypothetical protein